MTRRFLPPTPTPFDAAASGFRHELMPPATALFTPGRLIASTPSASAMPPAF